MRRSLVFSLLLAAAPCGKEARRAAAGYYASHRDTPFILGVLPHQLTVGLKKRF